MGFKFSSVPMISLILIFKTVATQQIMATFCDQFIKEYLFLISSNS